MRISQLNWWRLERADQTLPSKVGFGFRASLSSSISQTPGTVGARGLCAIVEPASEPHAIIQLGIKQVDACRPPARG